MLKFALNQMYLPLLIAVPLKLEAVAVETKQEDWARAYCSPKHNSPLKIVKTRTNRAPRDIPRILRSSARTKRACVPFLHAGLYGNSDPGNSAALPGSM